MEEIPHAAKMKGDRRIFWGLAAFFAIIGLCFIGGFWIAFNSNPKTEQRDSPFSTSAPPKASLTPYVYIPAPIPAGTSAPSAREAPRTVENPYATQLATLDKAPDSAPEIGYLIEQLEQETGDSAAFIADRTARSTLVLRQDGKLVSNRQFLDEAQAYFNGRGPKIGYKDLSTMLVIGFSGR